MLPWQCLFDILCQTLPMSDPNLPATLPHFAEILDKTRLDTIKLIATDLDGTLTEMGELTPALLQGLTTLRQSGLPLLIVTGRSAGWVNGLAAYLPIQGAIAENGGLFFPHDPNHKGILLTPIPQRDQHRRQLAAMFAQLQTSFPQIQTTADNAFRVTDWTFENPGFSAEMLVQMEQRCTQSGWGFTYSTVQCHIKPQDQTKQTGLLAVLNHHLEQTYTPQQVITIGDSPNDADLFNPNVFPHTVGVANIIPYLAQMKYQPAMVTHESEQQGFLELTRHLLTGPNHW
jgi:hypothetical protein